MWRGRCLAARARRVLVAASDDRSGERCAVHAGTTNAFTKGNGSKAAATAYYGRGSVLGCGEGEKRRAGETPTTDVSR